MWIPIVASSDSATAVSTTVTVGGVSHTFTVTTIAPVSTATIWYVDVDATGSDDGTSWADAFPNFHSDYITWANISGGDTIYISDGTYEYWNSVPQGLDLNAGERLNYTSEVVVAPAWQTGHTGTVEVVRTGNDAMTFQCYGLCNIKYYGINFEDRANVYTDTKFNVYVGYDSLVTFENCEFTTIGNPVPAVGTSYSTKITFLNCTIQSEANTYARAYDIMTFGYGYGGHTVRGCEIINRSAYKGEAGDGTGMTATSTSMTVSGASFEVDYHIDAHVTVGGSDMIVTSNTSDTFYGDSWTGGTPSNGTAWIVNTTQHRDVAQFNDIINTNDPSYTFTFDKNFIWVITPDATSYNQGFYGTIENAFMQRFVLTNNIFITSTADYPFLDPPDDPNGMFAVQMYSDDNSNSHVYWTVLNNTFINGAGGLNIDVTDSIICKNNFFIGNCDVSELQFMSYGYGNSHFATIYKDIDYNHYYLPNWDSDVRGFGTYSGTYYDWGEWQGLGLDTHSDTGYVSIADVVDSVMASYMPSSSMPGTDLSAYGITDDILGEPRVEWTIGAVEYTGGGMARKTELQEWYQLLNYARMRGGL